MADPITSLGHKLHGHEERDAIHIAIMPVTVRRFTGRGRLWAGQPVKFAVGSRDVVVRAEGPDYNDPGVGIIDPFLNDIIEDGDRVWLFLFPNTVTGMRHHWHHPAVDGPVPDYTESEKWLRTFAQEWNFDYEQLIEQASSESKTQFDAYVVARGRDLHSASELGADHELFWQHLSVLTGKTFDSEHRARFGWSCSC